MEIRTPSPARGGAGGGPCRNRAIAAARATRGESSARAGGVQPHTEEGPVVHEPRRLEEDGLESREERPDRQADQRGQSSELGLRLTWRPPSGWIGRADAGADGVGIASHDE